MSRDPDYIPAPSGPSTAVCGDCLLLLGLKPWVWRWLKDFQREGIAWAVGRGNAHFWWIAGAGKTASAIVWSLAGPPSTVVITRSAVRLQFAKEVRRLTTLDPYVVLPDGVTKRGRETLGAYLARVAWPFVILGWSTLHDDETYERLEALLRARSTSIVADEIHNIKSPRRVKRHGDGILGWVKTDGTPVDLDGCPVGMGLDEWLRSINATPILRELPPGAWRAREDAAIWFEPLQTIAARAARLAPLARRRLGLTATPVADRVRDLWSQLSFVEPGQHGKFWDWAKTFTDARESDFGWDTTGMSNVTALQRIVSVRAHTVAPGRLYRELPPFRRALTELGYEDLDRDDSAARRAVREAARRAGGGTGLENGGGDGAVDAREELLSARLLQAAARKHSYVTDTVMDCLGSGQKVLVFTGRRRDVELLTKKLGRRLDALIKKKHARVRVDAGGGPPAPEPVPRLWAAHGGSPPGEREKIREAYMAHEGPGVLVGTGDAFGEGLDFQHTDRLMIVLLPWNWKGIHQWEGRARRLGQDRPLLVEYVIAKGTVDERVAQLLLEKLEMVEALGGEAGGEAAEVRATLRGGTDEEIIDELLDRILEE